MVPFIMNTNLLFYSDRCLKIFTLPITRVLIYNRTFLFSCQEEGTSLTGGRHTSGILKIVEKLSSTLLCFTQGATRPLTRDRDFRYGNTLQYNKDTDVFGICSDILVT